MFKIADIKFKYPTKKKVVPSATKQTNFHYYLSTTYLLVFLLNIFKPKL